VLSPSLLYIVVVIIPSYLAMILTTYHEEFIIKITVVLINSISNYSKTVSAPSE